MNFKPDRWPAGDPETGYLNTDGSPTKTIILKYNRQGKNREIWNINFGKRGEEELFDIRTDPSCMINLAGNAEYSDVVKKLRDHLENELRDQNDPRIIGAGDVFDKYTYADEKVKDFYNRYMRGELSSKSAGWVDSTDFEPLTDK